ncbi:MAG: GxxExxY protein [Candidatus Paceibacterota bacterium]
MADILYKELSYEVIGAAMEVHKVLGPGFLEKIHQKAYEAELEKKSIPFSSQQRVEIYYKDVDLGCQRLDLVVAGKIIVELKAVTEMLLIHKAQLLSYLKATDYKLGILINFGSKSLNYNRIVLSKN